MKKLLVLIFCIKFYAQANIYHIIREKNGHEALLLTRRYERLCVKLEKLNSDIKFLLACKREKLIPTFSRPKLSIYANQKIKAKISTLIVEVELRNKHQLRKKLEEKAMWDYTMVGCYHW